MSPLLATVVSLCSNERAYARDVLRNAAVFSDVVVVSVGSRLYTGAPEDEAFVSALAAEFSGPGVAFVRYDVPETPGAAVALHNAARAAGVAEARRLIREKVPDGEEAWFLLLDGDEVPDGARFAEWWGAARDALADRPRDIVKLANYWHFLVPGLVARHHEDSVVLASSALLTPAALSHPRERDGIAMAAMAAGPPPTLRRRVPGLDGRPMFSHHSWDRGDREALGRKVANWGHTSDGRPWPALIARAFDELDAGRPPPTVDFVHGHALASEDASDRLAVWLPG